mgnify:CR=1 FL=1
MSSRVNAAVAGPPSPANPPWIVPATVVIVPSRALVLFFARGFSLLHKCVNVQTRYLPATYSGMEQVMLQDKLSGEDNSCWKRSQLYY